MSRLFVYLRLQTTAAIEDLVAPIRVLQAQATRSLEQEMQTLRQVQEQDQRALLDEVSTRHAFERKRMLILGMVQHRTLVYAASLTACGQRWKPSERSMKRKTPRLLRY